MFQIADRPDEFEDRGVRDGPGWTRRGCHWARGPNLTASPLRGGLIEYVGVLARPAVLARVLSEPWGPSSGGRKCASDEGKLGGEQLRPFLICVLSHCPWTSQGEAYGDGGIVGGRIGWSRPSYDSDDCRCLRVREADVPATEETRNKLAGSVAQARRSKCWLRCSCLPSWTRFYAVTRARTGCSPVALLAIVHAGTRTAVCGCVTATRRFS